MTTTSHCDVAVVGGGPAGCATAVALVERGLSTTLVEASTAPVRAGETVPQDIEPLLARLGLWEEFLGDGHLRAGATASAWGSSELAWYDDVMSATGTGWHLDRARFDAMLARRAVRGGATLLPGWRIAGLGRASDDGWALVLRAPGHGEHRLRASFVVDASGRAAVAARRLGVVPVVIDHLVCVSTVLPLGTTAPANPHTVIESVEEGWWYAGRIPDGQVVTAFFTDADLLRRRSGLGPQGWHDLLRQTSHVFELLGRPPMASTLVLTSARSQCLPQVVGDGWLAVGDAAMAWDPLTSAGIVLGLRCGVRGSEAVALLLAGDRNAGAGYQEGLRSNHARYLAERRAYYALERRWPGSDFWRRRTAGQLVRSDAQYRSSASTEEA